MFNNNELIFLIKIEADKVNFSSIVHESPYFSCLQILREHSSEINYLQGEFSVGK